MLRRHVRPTGLVPALDPSSGGMYQYGLALIKSLEAIDPHGSEFLILWRGLRLRQRLGPWPSTRLETIVQSISRHLTEFRDDEAPGVDDVNHRRATSARLRRLGIQLMIFAAPDPLSVELDLPFVMPVHDLQHRLQPQFPEVSAAGEWERREYLYRNAVRSRSVLVTDSEVGREDLLVCYGEFGLTPDRVEVLPFLPSPQLDVSISPDEAHAICQRLGVPKGFLFYPAQFWPHKGHLGLVRGLAVLSQHGARLPLVLVGANSGALRRRTYDDVMELAGKLGVADHIHYLGYVTDTEMSALYREAAALVMPTYFGPTNIPVVEAWAFGCPVVTSDIRGIREQTGDAALLIDPDSPDAIAHAIERLLNNEELRAALVQAGYERLHRYPSTEHERALAKIIHRARERFLREDEQGRDMR